MPLFRREDREPSTIARADRAREAGQWALAAGFYRVALDRRPRNPPIWIQYGHALKESGKRAEAEAAYRNAITYDPDDADAYLQLGHVLKLQGKIVEARFTYQRALALDESLTDAAHELSRLEPETEAGRQNGGAVDVRASEQALRLAVAATAGPAIRRRLKRGKGSLISRADRAREALQWDIAADFYRRALDRNPDNPPIWVQFGHALKETGKLAEAERAYRAAIARDPAIADSHLQLGHVLKLEGNQEEAEAAYLRSFALDPAMPHACEELRDLGWSETRLGELRRLSAKGPLGTLAGLETGAEAGSREPVEAPDLSELRGLQPRGRIAVVLHLFYPELWDEMREGIETISQPFDLFVSLTRGASAHMRETILKAFPHAYVSDFPDRGRDIGSFLSFLASGVLFKYDLVCKLHTKRSPHRADGDAWRRALIAGVLGSTELVERIVASFASDPDLGMVVAEGHIYGGRGYWRLNEARLAPLLPRLGISSEVTHRRFPGGSIFWIRPFLLRTLAGLKLTLSDFETEPLTLDGGLGHAVERVFGLICEEAGMRFVEHTQLPETRRRPGTISKLSLIAFYRPQVDTMPKNDARWSDGFTDWTIVSGAKPLFTGHRQPRLPADLGFYDLRLPDIREAQAKLACRYRLTGFCYYYYWFKGRRIPQHPLDEVLANGSPDFPFLICWANEPWTRNGDGFGRDVSPPQRYEAGWVGEFARDIAPLLRDCWYFRLEGKPMLLIDRICRIPQAAAAMDDLRSALREQGVADIHIAAAWSGFSEDGELPNDPAVLGLDAYYEMPPHRLPKVPLRPPPPDLPDGFTGEVYDYNAMVSVALDRLADGGTTRQHRGVMTGWDCTPRRKEAIDIYHGATPANFRRWLRGVIEHEASQPGQRVIFINAWNEWEAGAYLEPDQDFGCGWLEAVASATGYRVSPRPAQ